MKLSIMTLSIKAVLRWMSLMLSATYTECHIKALFPECRYAECHYAECHIKALFAECHCAECRYAGCHYYDCRGAA